jgi:hypothetical protein
MEDAGQKSGVGTFALLVCRHGTSSDVPPSMPAGPLC